MTLLYSDGEKDETSHLKDRIAELEGFIREFKKKPHPRWLDDGPTGKRDSSSSSPSLTAIQPFTQVDQSRPDAPEDTPMATPGSDQLTPPNHSSNPVLLSPQGTSESSSSSGSGTKLPEFLLMCTGLDSSPATASGSSNSQPSPEAHSDFSSALFPFGNYGVGVGGGDVGFEHAFAQILHNDARRALAQGPSYTCQCVKKSSVYSVVLELAPHIRRAVDALAALPGHNANPANGSFNPNPSCEYYSYLRNLDNTTSCVPPPFISVFDG